MSRGRNVGETLLPHEAPLGGGWGQFTTKATMLFRINRMAYWERALLRIGIMDHRLPAIHQRIHQDGGRHDQLCSQISTAC